MNTKKRLWSATCIGLPLVGFALICVGVFQMSVQSEGRYVVLRLAMAYVEVVAGFLAMLVGVFWAVCQGTRRSRRYLGGVQGAARRTPQEIFTVDRFLPGPFPPSYEESQRRCVNLHSTALGDQGVSVGTMGEDGPPPASPPPYTECSSDVPECTWAWEQPPPYTQAPPLPCEHTPTGTPTGTRTHAHLNSRPSGV